MITKISVTKPLNDSVRNSAHECVKNSVINSVWVNVWNPYNISQNDDEYATSISVWNSIRNAMWSGIWMSVNDYVTDSVKGI